jgi:hypothetical protein
MPLGLALMFQNQADGNTCVNCRVPKDVEIDVGPSISVPLPKQYLEDGEKYGSQIRLVRAFTGGWEIQNYTAGLPFSKIDASDPQAGIKLLYNIYYRMLPAFQIILDSSLILENHLGHITSSTGLQVQDVLAFLSDPNYPQTLPGAGDYSNAQYGEQIAPEQVKYTATLRLFHRDPIKIEETYTYVPALRRSLRLSAASRCAPVYGTDMAYDDIKQGFAGEPPYFLVKLLGKKSVLMLSHIPPGEPKLDGAGLPSDMSPPTYFPPPNYGQWEVRPVYVADAVRVPFDSSGYCYSHRVLYVDAQTFRPWWTDSFDMAGKFWKAIDIPMRPKRLPGTNDLVFGQADFFFNTRDFQNDHQTLSIAFKSYYDTEAPAQYRSLSRYAMPSGLDQILQ